MKDTNQIIVPGSAPEVYTVASHIKSKQQSFIVSIFKKGN